MLTNNVDKLDVGMGQYTFLLNDGGGIIDDLIVYRIDEQKYLLVVNAARADEDFAWLQNHLKEGAISGSPRRIRRRGGGQARPPFACTLTNRSADFGAVAIQGPRTMALFHALFGKDIEMPARNHIVDVPFDTTNVSVARTGYTGEDGIEVFFRANDAVKFWSAALEQRQAVRNQAVRPGRARHVAAGNVLPTQRFRSLARNVIRSRRGSDSSSI